MVDRPTILFLHGVWHGPQHFGPIMEVFKQDGFSVSCPRLPVYDGPPGLEMYEDARCARRELDRLVEVDGRDVVVVGHSYGAIVMSQAVDASLGKKARQDKGQKGGVLRLVYMCTLVLPLGKSFMSLGGGSLPPSIIVDGNGTCTTRDPEHHFYNDLLPEEQKRWVAKLRPGPVSPASSPLTYTAYQYHPVSFLYCENDQTTPVKLQRTMVAASGVEFDIHTCSAGHSPFLSQPESVLDCVKKGLEHSA